ncbi:MAG TPA: hypothetical protein VHE79_00520 [Spirochaetia bacterium]
MRTRSWFSLATLLVALACALPLFAAPAIGAPTPSVIPPENWEARERFRDTIFASLAEAAARPRAVVTQDDGAARVAFSTQRQAGALYLVFANQRGGSYPLDGAGTFIIKRSLANGRFVQAKLFVQDGPGTFLRFYPDDERTVMDVVLFGQPFQTRVPLAIPFDNLLTTSLASVMDLSASSVDWPTILAPTQREGDRRLESMVKAIRPRLRSLRDMDDGAMDATGRMVYIATGEPAGKGGFNCSGFAKWIVDGLFAPLAGSLIDIAGLKSRDSLAQHSWSSRYEEELDPYFGLDWSRGLARALAKARDGAVPTDGAIDVRDDTRLPYVPDTGYAVTQLEYLLYFLTRESPGTMYLGSVNAAAPASVSQGTPTLRMHHHVVVLFPYFDASGGFRVVVMERNHETGIESLARRYAAESVHLVRIDSEGDFNPPKIE